MFSGSGVCPPGIGGGVTAPMPMTPSGQQQYQSTPVHGETPSARPYPYSSPMVMSTPAAVTPGGYGSYGNSNVSRLQESAGALGRAVVGPEIMLSGKHNGLCRYLARLLR